MRNIILFIVIGLGLSSCCIGGRCDYECIYIVEVSGIELASSEATCENCYKSDVEELEDAGWRCKKLHQ